MSPLIRAASAADWPAIAALLEQSRLPLDGAADHLGNFLVADQEGRLLGVGGLEVHGDAALLRSLAVAEPGHGLGSHLVRELVALARARGVHDVVLLTTTAAAFFPRFGFVSSTRDAVPAALHASAEFRGACPASAHVMALSLRQHELT